MTYRKNVAGQFIYFALVNASTGAALTGATVTARRCIDGGAQANATGSVTERGNGQYEFALSQADTNGNQIGLLFTAAGAIPVHYPIVTTAADPTSAANLGLSDVAAIKAKTDNLPSDPADASDIAAAFVTLNTKVDTIDDLLDTEMPAATSSLSSLHTKVDGVKAKTDLLPASFPANFSALAITAGGLVSIATGQIAIKKNTQLANFMFMMVDSTDHVTPKTGLTVTANRSIDGAAFAACANSVSEVSNGWYKITLAAADLNGDVIALRFTGSGADARNIGLVTQA